MAFVDTSYISSVNNKLPTTLGQKTAANSLAVVLSSDAYVQLSYPENRYQTIRTFSSTVADSGVPSSFVSLNNATSCGFAEFVWSISNVGGTVAASVCKFMVWNRVGSNIVKLDEFTVPSSYLKLGQETNPILPKTYPCNSDEVYVTWSAEDGTAPTIDGYIYARAVATPGSEYNLKVRNLETKHEVIETRGYDSSSDSIKITPTLLDSDIYLEELLVVDTTGVTVAAGVQYYPSSDGVLIAGYSSISWEYSITAANSGYLVAYWQATNGSNTFSQANNITLSGSELTLGAQHSSSTLTTAINGTLSGITCFDNLNVTRIRFCVQSYVGTSGSIKVSIRRTSK